jgi:hypothetical protein
VGQIKGHSEDDCPEAVELSKSDSKAFCVCQPAPRDNDRHIGKQQRDLHRVRYCVDVIDLKPLTNHRLPAGLIRSALPLARALGLSFSQPMFALEDDPAFLGLCHLPVPAGARPLPPIPANISAIKPAPAASMMKALGIEPPQQQQQQNNDRKRKGGRQDAGYPQQKRGRY